VVALATTAAATTVPWGQLSAASNPDQFPVVLAYVYAQRLLVEGLSVGAVKG
jgi:ABC-type glycerol-3-phosphate transport system permease component